MKVMRFAKKKNFETTQSQITNHIENVDGNIANFNTFARRVIALKC